MGEPNVCYTGQSIAGVCENLPAVYSHNGNHYCILHHPYEGKGDNFCDVLDARLRDPHSIDLRGVWVPSEYSSYFKNRAFRVAANFSGAIFRGVADFDGTKFRSVSFRNAQFCGEVTFSSKFCGDAVFDHATFCAVATFRDA